MILPYQVVMQDKWTCFYFLFLKHLELYLACTVNTKAQVSFPVWHYSMHSVIRCLKTKQKKGHCMNNFSGREQMEAYAWWLLDLDGSSMYNFAVINCICEYNAFCEFCRFFWWILNLRVLLGLPKLKIHVRSKGDVEDSWALHGLSQLSSYSGHSESFMHTSPLDLFIPIFQTFPFQLNGQQPTSALARECKCQNLFSSRKSGQPDILPEIIHSVGFSLLVVLSNAVILCPSKFHKSGLHFHLLLAGLRESLPSPATSGHSCRFRKNSWAAEITIMRFWSSRSCNLIVCSWCCWTQSHTYHFHLMME